MEIAAIALILATMIASKAAAQNNGCSSVMMTLSPCLDFIGSKALEPGFSCCTTLAGIVQTDPRCLCMVLDGSAASFGIVINHTRALELPSICKVQAPPISQCTAIPVPPATAPEDPPEETSNQSNVPPIQYAIHGENSRTNCYIIQFNAGSPNSNATSSSRNSKSAANLMVTMLIPTCALIYVF
ncbi:non-specific lipid transfer protein GPI-anchored 5-like [Triticum urartu]|uniref:non-specific lipid transfer protein GPI-anchored 5-like n=1 Tax=Triticum urartu TaxID=4572 RepID=UPI00204301E6|nr:non-specific lipid transfer protein GPI-anchored 5-like [Triticum urartu]